MNKLSKLRQQSASSLGSFNSRHAATHNPLSAVAHIKADNASASSRQTADNDNKSADEPDNKRQKLATSSASSASSSSSALHIPDPNATQDRVRRKAPTKPTQSSTGTSQSSSAAAGSATAASSAAAGGGGAWNIQDDVTSERRFYQTVLSLDPTKPDSSTATTAPPLPTASPPPPPPCRFPDTRAYQSFFLPLLLSDFAAQLQQSYDANAALTHSYAAQLSPLIMLHAAGGREAEGGRGAGEDMWRVELIDGGGGGMDREERRRCERQVREWMSGDLALLRHHQKDEAADEAKEPTRGGSRGGRGSRGHDRQRIGGRLRATAKVDCYVMCVVESVSPMKGDDEFAPAFAVRLRAYLPGTSAFSSLPPSSLPSGVGSLERRSRQMWNLFRPPPLEEKDENGSSTAGKPHVEGMFSLIRLDSPVTTLREYIALQHIDSLTLLPHLLQPSPDPTALSTADGSPPSLLAAASAATEDVERTFALLPGNFRSYLFTHLNEHQLLAVKSAAHRSLSPGFTLLQGPPGTGN